MATTTWTVIATGEGLMSTSRGAYSFESVIPGHYPDRICQHTHYLVTAPGHKTLVTELYFATDPVFDGDPQKNYSRDPVIETPELIRPVVLAGDPQAIHAEEKFAQTIKRESSIALPPGMQVVLASMASSGDRVAAVGGDGAVRVWKLPSGDLAKTLEMGQPATAVQFSSDSRLIAIGDETGTVKVWDVSSWQVVLEFSAASDAWINALAISRDDGLLAVANDYDVQVWNLSTHQRVATVRAPFGHSFALSFSPDSRWLASADQDAVVRLYDPHTGGLRSSVTDLLLESFSLDFSPDGKSLLVGGADRTISVIDPVSGKIVGALPKQSGLPKTLLVSTDGKQAAAIYPLP